MATKNKANSLVGNILGGNTEPKMQEEKAPVAAPVRVAADEERPSTEKGTKEGETRATFIVNKELVRKVKYISLVGGSQIKDEINAALEAHIQKWEAANGAIKLPAAK